MIMFKGVLMTHNLLWAMDGEQIPQLLIFFRRECALGSGKATTLAAACKRSEPSVLLKQLARLWT
jgi:hypothetical protein